VSGVLSLEVVCSRANIQIYLSGLCMMSVYREKVSEDKQGFIDRFGRDPRRLQLALVSK